MVASRRGNGGGNEPEDPEGIDPARGALLEEARSTLGEQLGQIDKIDEAAVRTVRLSVLLLGVLAGSATAGLGPGVGLATAAGMVGLILAIVGAVTVYGTSTAFVGSAPDTLTVEYTTQPVVEDAFIEMLSKYEVGISDNRETLRTNGLVLGVSRALLVLSVLVVLFGLLGRGAAAAAAITGVSTQGTVILMLLSLRPSTDMSEEVEGEPEDEDESYVRAEYVTIGPKPLAEAKIRFGEWLEEKGL